MNNYKIIRTIYENVFQRILECKDNDTGEIFYSNIITSQKVINLIDIEDLKKIQSNILECYSTGDRVFIFTKPLDTACRKFRDYVNKSLTLKQQFNLTEKSINLAADIFNMTDVVQQKILDLDRLFVDDNNDIIVDCNLVFEQEYDIADNETFKRLGNIIHMAFSGTEIIDYNISDAIPPDILKIIVRCLTREYLSLEDAMTELKKSSIYLMIFGEEVFHEPKEKPKQKIEEKKREAPLVNKVEADDKVVNIYLEEDEPDYEPVKKKKSKVNKNISKDIIRAAVSLLIVVVVLLAGNAIIKKVRDKGAETVNSPEQEQPGTEAPSSEDENIGQGDSIIDSTQVHFNDGLLENIGYTGKRAEIDNEIYLEGNSSLLVSNGQEEKVKALFATVDLTDENYDYMQMKQIGVSAKIKSQNDVEAQIIFEAYKDGVIKSNFHTLVDVYDDIWSQVTVPINVTDAELLNIYLEYEGENKVWIDSIGIDVVK